ncbi:hypothetical protein L596_011687 [Steinernema carpocapsae]|uniref:SLED domain-containing protein n=1 Tax=Steinernema carpocapsae TaxID=34508 RepID=A0A4U5NVN4_STECR|nr:hypothetical protein L596_011687 [Steinernema carpocapsae]
MTSTSNQAVPALRWNVFMDQTALQPATDPALFKHHHFLRKTVAERCLIPGTLTAVRFDDDRWIRVKVEQVCFRQVLVGEVDGDDVIDWFPLERCCYPDRIPDEAEDFLGFRTPSSSIHEDDASTSTADLSSVALSEENEEEGEGNEPQDDRTSERDPDTESLEPEDEGRYREGENPESQDPENPESGFQQNRTEEGPPAEGEPKLYRIKRQLMSKPMEPKRWDFLANVTHEYFQQLATRQLIDLIREGQYFEVQDRTDPLTVYIVCIKEIYGGVVKVVHPATATFEVVLITSERCHRVGWCLSQECQKTRYAPDSQPWLEQAKIKPTPDIIFEFSKIGNHKFETGMMVEMLDYRTRTAFYPGYVCDVINNHYFLVKIVRDMQNDDEVVICHKKQYFIFPCGFCQRNNLRLTTPTGKRLCLPYSSIYSAFFSGFGENEFTWGEFASRLKLICFAPEALFSLPKLLKPIHKMRHLELFAVTNGQPVCYPATITRTLKHLIWIHMDADSAANPSLIYTSQWVFL